VVSNGFTQVNFAPQYEEGAEFVVKNADGALCVNDKDTNELKRVNLEAHFCNIDPDLLVLWVPGRELTTGAPATGTGVAWGAGQITGRFSFEIWQRIAGTAACAANGLPQYVYWAFMNVGNGMLKDWTVENGPTTIVTSGETKVAGPLWGDGPGSGTSYLGGSSALITDHFAYNITTNAPPVASCGAVLLT
jgi:hypothetical protein